MRLDRAQGNEQRLCDLAVAEAFGGHCRYPVLARGERVDAAGGQSPRPGAAGDQLLVGTRGEDRRAATLSQFERQPKRLPRLRPPVPPPQQGAEVRPARTHSRGEPAKARGPPPPPAAAPTPRPWREGRLGGRPRVERSASVRLGV